MFSHKNKKILVVSLYPITDPANGGQKRARAIVDYYSKIFKEVKHVGVFPRGAYDNFSDEDLNVAQPDIGLDLQQHPYALDYIVGEAISKDIHIRSRLAKTIQDFKPDAVQVEEVYPYIGLSDLIKDLNISPLLIYSSYNVEYKMKESIYSFLNVKKEERTKLINSIRTYESRLAKVASLTITVSKEDADSYSKMGAKRVVVAKNGIAPHKSTTSEQDEWIVLRKKHKFKKIALFIGSGHPPNWEGFHTMIGSKLDFIPDDTKILVAGGVANFFNDYYKSNPKSNYKDKVILLGQIDDKRLNSLIDQADIILLPIISGGGSNLKTAEAILSQKKIVSTPYSFRGFEEYVDLPNIYIADNQARFKKEFVRSLKSPYVSLSQKELEKAQQVTWDNCLNTLNRSLRKAYFLHRLEHHMFNKASRMVKRIAKKLLAIF